MNGNLLDTHTFIWYVSGDTTLSSKVREAIESRPEANFVSIASLWEIAIKISLGKLTLDRPFSAIEQQLKRNGFQILPIGFEDVLKITNMVFHHKDPFDRVIIAQGINNNLRILSKDSFFVDYPVQVLW